MFDAIIISDLHLGSDICRVDKLLNFLENLPPTHLLILNGDVLENTEHRLTKNHWRVLSHLRKLSDNVDIIWNYGNHDLGAHSLAHLIGAEYTKYYILESGNKRILCIHGDKWDKFLTDHPVIVWVADLIYSFFQYWHVDFAVYLKHNSKTFLRCANVVKQGAIKLAKKLNCDIAICGHTHHAEYNENYINSGDWCEPTCHYITVDNGITKLEIYDERNSNTIAGTSPSSEGEFHKLPCLPE